MSETHTRSFAPPRFLRLTGIAVLGIATLAILGSLAGWPRLTMWVPARSGMVMNTAGLLLVCGLGLLFVAAGLNRAAQASGLAVAVIAATFSAQFLSRQSTAADTLYWHSVGDGMSAVAGGMAPTTAIAFVVVGLALALMAWPRSPRLWLTVAGAGVLMLPALSLLNFIGPSSDDIAAYPAMALPTIVSFLLLAGAILRFAAVAPPSEEAHLPPLLATAVSLLITVAIVSALTNADLIASARRMVRSHAVQANIDQVVSRVARMESNARAYAMGGDEALRTASINHAHQLVQALNALGQLVVDDPVRSAQAREFARRAREKIEHNDAVLAARQSSGALAPAAKLILAPGGAATNGMIELGNEMKLAETRQLAHDETETALLLRSTHVTQIFGSALALVLVGLTVFQTTRAARARQRLESARAEMLGRLEKIGRQVPGMIYQFRVRPDGTACFPYASDGVRTIFGLSPEEVREDAGKVFAAIHPDDLAMVRRSNAESARTLAPWHREYRVRPAGGAEHWVLGRAVPEREPDGGVLWHGFVTDITERKRLEENLAQARDQALESSRLKSEFLATISHEIRTPMNSVIGMASLLEQTQLDAEQREMTRTIVAGGDNLLAIINDILDFSKIEAGRVRIEARPFDFRRLIEETLALQAPRAQQKRLQLSSDCGSLSPSVLLGDSDRLRQVLTNLVGNAIKFTDAGFVKVELRVLAENSSCPLLRVAVRDTGVGIPASAQRLLFQPFTQVDGSFSRRFGGTGLGLAISRQLIELMGGKIGCESEPDKGSVFWFEIALPRAEALTNHDDPTATAPERSPAKEQPVGEPAAGFPAPAPAGSNGTAKKRLLIVEDNPANRRVAGLILERMGYDVTVANNGQLALVQLATQPYDGVLMDCQMPLLDGYDTTRHIRSGKVRGIDARIPIIALSAYARPEDRQRSLDAGMDDHVSKPIDLSELRAALERAGLAGERSVDPHDTGLKPSSAVDPIG
jgi:PAS domain S-box-containing protein